jgi:hypothetical protein
MTYKRPSKQSLATTMMDLNALKETIKPYQQHEGQGHWRTNEPLVIKELHGFVYLIHNSVDDKYYVGKKNFLHGGKKNYVTKGIKRPNYRHGTETNWKTYTGSSAELNLDISKHEIIKFSFTIIRVYSSRGGLSYGEANIQHKLDVLTTRDSNDKAKFYNGNIAGLKFIPKETGRSA